MHGKESAHQSRYCSHANLRRNGWLNLYLLAEKEEVDIKNHLLGWFGSYGWASKAVSEIARWNEEKLHYEQVGEPVEIKQSLTPETKAQCEALGRAMAERLLR